MANTLLLPRHKPAVLGVTALAAALGIYLLWRQVQNVHKEVEVQEGGLHRSNAIRRYPARRPTVSQQVSLEEARLAIDQAIANLRRRDAEGDSYGYCIERNDGVETAYELLPSKLPTVEELVEVDGIDTMELALSIRLRVEESFVESFLDVELENTANFPPAAIIHLIAELKPFGLNAGPVRQPLADRERELLLVHTERSDNTANNNNNNSRAGRADGEPATGGVGNIIQALDGHETVEGSDSESEYDADGNSANTGTSQNMLDLLYHIAGDQARRNGYIHRGVECNSCGACPIQGVRFHCANCFDYDLCETCEAGQVHIRTHVLFKIRIPGPTRGNVKEVAPVWYTGKPDLLPESLSKSATKKLLKLSGIDKEELDALYDQFRNLANQSIEADEMGLCVAINRAAFDKYFACTGTSRHTPPSLVWDRIFSYYDEKQDGVIDFEEFVMGLTRLQDTSREARLLRIFKGYDLDGDGYVDRKDFLRMFRSYYAWCKQLNRELVTTLEEDQVTDDVRELIESSQPISAAFPNGVPYAQASRAGMGKEVGAHGNLIVSDGRGALDEDSNVYGDRNEAIGTAALGNRPRTHPYRSYRPSSVVDEPVHARTSASGDVETVAHIADGDEEDLYRDDPTLPVSGWPPMLDVEPRDIMNALGRDIPLDDITDPVDRSRVFVEQSKRLDAEHDRGLQEIKNRAVQERWQRRQFYLDQEEGMTAPPGYTEHDSSDEEDLDKEPPVASEDLLGSRRPSMRSRSSSKVRFEDDLTDTDYETRSNTSSRSIPVGERWGGFEISEAEKEVGKELLYQAVQQGFNELLDQLFKDTEDLAMAAAGSREGRKRWAQEILEYKKSVQKRAHDQTDALRAADMLRTEEMLAGGDPVQPVPDPATPPSQKPAASTDSVEQAHQLLQGVRPIETPQPDAVSSVSSSDAISQAHSPLHADATSPDPTLPQNRPNVWDEHASVADEAATQAAAQSSSPDPTRPAPRPPSPATMDTYLDHYAAEAEARRRGGRGRISFIEFAAKMIEDSRTETEKALGTLEPETDRTGKWPKSAGLGRLGFVDKWLDWAHF